MSEKGRNIFHTDRLEWGEDKTCLWKRLNEHKENDAGVDFYIFVVKYFIL